MFILKAYQRLRDQGFYEPHVRVTPRGRIERVEAADGSWSTLIQMRVDAEICTRAPTKLDFINALGFIQPLMEDEARVVAKGGAGRAWYQFVADKVFPGCKHDDCFRLRHPKSRLQLISDCFVTLPRVALNPMQEHPLYW